MPFLREFQCDACELAFEDLMPSSADRVTACKNCGARCEAVMSAPRVGAFSGLSPEARAEVLRKRSHQHTMKELKKEPEKYGFAAAEKRPWNIRSTKPSE